MASDAITAKIPEVIPISAAPAPPSERLPALDLLRGVAILAILPANFPLFSGALNHWTIEAIPAGPLDHAAHSFSLFFFFGKFITILSMLFGAGLALQAWRAEYEKRPFAAYYLRRMAWLFVLGLAHGLLLWYGDILSSYAVVGAGALLISRFPQRVWLWIAAVCLVYILAWFCLILVGSLFVGQNFLAGGMTGLPDTPPKNEVEAMMEDLARRWQEHASTEGQTRVWREGGFLSMVLDRTLYLGNYALGFWLMAGWYILACFLIGMDLLRRGVFHDFDAHRRLVRWLIIGGLTLGVPLQMLTVALYLWAPAGGLYLMLPYSLGALPMALAYLGAGLWWAHSGRLAWLQHCFAATGRLALSNYILQSILCNLIFYSFGLAWYGRVGHAAGLALVAGIWLVEIGLSVVWLRVFAIGPVEWLWRSLAEGRLLPVRAQPIVDKTA